MIDFWKGYLEELAAAAGKLVGALADILDTAALELFHLDEASLFGIRFFVAVLVVRNLDILSLVDLPY